MPPAARVGDGTGHPGVIGPPGVPTVLVGGLPAATVGTPHACSFPPPAVHPPTAIMPPGCPTVLIGGRPAARVGDLAGCGAPVLSGCPTVLIGGWPAMAEQFVGAGWAFFPMRTDVTGGIALVERDREIAEAIRLILATAPGERPMRPDFGCAIHDFVFAPADAATAGQIAFEVRAALDRWEPRVDVLDVRVGFAEADRGALHIEVRYAIRGTNDPRNLVFPFYMIPAHDTQGGPS